jgi:hypothetical protein
MNDDTKEKKAPHLVSDRTKEQEQEARERKARSAEIELRWKLAELMANLLRIAAGRGETGFVWEQVRAVDEAFREGEELSRSGTGIGALDCISRTLQRLPLHPAPGQQRESVTRPPSRMESAMGDIVDGAMRLVASQLLDQGPHENMARNKIRGGIDDYVASEKATRAIRRRGSVTGTKS